MRERGNNEVSSLKKKSKGRGTDGREEYRKNSEEKETKEQGKERGREGNKVKE